MTLNAAWSTASASVRGSSHSLSDTVNQDAIQVTTAGSMRIVALADGHGGAQHVRSDRGARMAVEAACQAAPQFFGPDCVGALALAGAARSFVDSMVRQWREQVLYDAAHHPFSGPEVACMAGADPLTAYGSTVLVAIARPGDLTLCQLGDGDIAAMLEDGDVVRPVPGDGRLVANQTTSLCLPSADQDFRVVALDLAAWRVSLVVLSTDGYGNAFADSAWEREALAGFRQHLDDHGLDFVNANLESWIGESAAVGGDDVTVALLSATYVDAPPESIPGAGSLATMAVPRGHPESAPAFGSAHTPDSAIDQERAPSRRRWVRPFVVALVAAVLAAAFALGIWQFLGPDDSDVREEPAPATSGCWCPGSDLAAVLTVV